MVSSKRKVMLKRTVVAVAAILGIVAVWYGQSRLFAPMRAVRIFSAQAAPQPPASALPGHLRFAAWNIAHGRGGAYGAGNWTGRSRDEILAHLARIAEQIKAIDADIVVLNEVDIDAAWSLGINQPRVIAELAGYPHRVEQRNVDVSLPFFRLCIGNAVLSRFPITDARLVRFPSLKPLESIFAGSHDGTVVTIDSPLGPVQVLACHLEARSEQRRVEAARIILPQVTARTAPFIALGDFNSAPDFAKGHQLSPQNENAMDVLLGSGEFQVMTPPGGWDSFLTFPSEKPHKAIDWIIHTSEFDSTPINVVNSDLSDHLMVTSDLNPAAASPAQ